VSCVQSLAVLLLLGVCFPYWIVHICVVAFCLWGPPVMIALMTTAWQPERQRVSICDCSQHSRSQHNCTQHNCNDS
jgi:hypothetical protein